LARTNPCANNSETHVASSHRSCDQVRSSPVPRLPKRVPSYCPPAPARASSVGGTSRPSAFAVLRLMINLRLDRLMDRQIGSIAIALPVLSARETPTSTPSSSAMNCACASICKAVLVDGQVYAWIHQLLQPSRR